MQIDSKKPQGNEANTLLPPVANHPQGIIGWIKEKLICNRIGHARHTAFEKGRYQPKYCYRCGKHISNWR